MLSSVNESSLVHWFSGWLIACTAPGQCLIQNWLVCNLILGAILVNRKCKLENTTPSYSKCWTTCFGVLTWLQRTLSIKDNLQRCFGICNWLFCVFVLSYHGYWLSERWPVKENDFQQQPSFTRYGYCLIWFMCHSSLSSIVTVMPAKWLLMVWAPFY